jgi:hypothetical protein
MFPVQRVRGTETGDGSRRLAKTWNSGGIHLSKDFCTRGTRINKFGYDDSGTVPYDEKREPLTPTVRERIYRGRRRWIVFSPTAIPIDLHALKVAEQSMEKKIEEFWRGMGEGKRNKGGLVVDLGHVSR